MQFLSCRRVVLFAISACLSAGPAFAQDSRKMQFVLSSPQHDLKITAEYLDPAELDERLGSSRVLPVRLTIQNLGARPVEFNYEDARLNLNGTQVLTPVRPADIEREIRRTGRVPALLGMMANQSSAFYRSAVQQQQLRDSTLRPGQEKQGFVYFMRPEGPVAPTSSSGMWLEAAGYRPQLLETKGIRVWTRNDDRTFGMKVADFVNIHVRGNRPPFNRSYALLIGIGAYRQLPFLSSPASDVQKMMTFLIAQGFDEIVEIRDADVTLDRLRSPQQYFKTKILPDDRFLFYYSGHGTSIDAGNGRARGYLPLVDEGYRSYGKSIAMDSLVTWMTALSAKHVLLILDSCFSGLAVNGTELKSGNDLTVDRERLSILAEGPARFLLMAGTAGQESIGDRRWNGSLFTDAIIRGLEKEAWADMQGDRIITTRELYIWLRDIVSGEARKVQRELTPLLKDLGPGGASVGEFVFVRKL
jgi:hypothetical protein